MCLRPETEAWVVGCGGLPMSVGGRDIPHVKVTQTGEPLGGRPARLDENVILTD